MERQRRLVDIGHHDPHTLGHKGLGEGQPDPAGRAGHDGHLVPERAHGQIVPRLPPWLRRSCAASRPSAVPAAGKPFDSPGWLQVTVKDVDVVAEPLAVCTVIGPVVAPAGTFTTIWGAVSELTFALTPLKGTEA